MNGSVAAALTWRDGQDVHGVRLGLASVPEQMVRAGEEQDGPRHRRRLEHALGHPGQK